jgi:basic amino acid/polyamine antiporter, APA family
MITADMPLAAARDGLFPIASKRSTTTGVPAFGIVASTLLASLAMIINYLGSSGATVCTTLVLMTGITSAVAYLFSALAQMKRRLIYRRQIQTARFICDTIVAVPVVVCSADWRERRPASLASRRSPGGRTDRV